MKKKHFLWCLLSSAILAVPACCLTACGDDDDDEGGNGTDQPGVIDQQTGTRLASYQNSENDLYVYSYGANGRLTGISYNGENTYAFTYNPDRIINNDDEDMGETMIDVTYDKHGRLAGVKSEGEGRYENQRWKENSTSTVSYDSNGHVTRISSNSVETGNNSEGNYTSTTKLTYTFTWRDNNLTQVVYDETENDTYGSRDDDSNYHTVITYNFAYDNAQTNKFRQWVPSLGEEIFDGGLTEVMSYVGTMGVGPALLPTSMSYTETFDGSVSDEETKHFSYRLNDAGAVTVTNIDGELYRFTYGTASTPSKAKAAKLSLARKQTSRHFGPFHKALRR